jgi:retron-type reverse transcriptase
VIGLAHALQYGGYHHVVEADIRGFFDHMDHDWVIRMLIKNKRFREKSKRQSMRVRNT